jgi:hypothetical protein
MKKIAFALALLLAGCTTTTGVVPMGKDTYMVSRSDNTITASLGTIKQQALNDAREHCAKSGQSYSVVGGYDVPRALGQFPQTEVQFKCVAN